MDHQTFIKALPDQDRMVLTTKSDRAGLLHLAGHIGIIAAFMAWVAAGWPLWWLALVPLGIALTFLFTLAHEATHQTPFATRWINEAVGHLAGLILILPFQWFRLFHMAHHRFTNDPERDPELASPKPETRAQYAWYLTGHHYWRSVVQNLMQNALGRFNRATYIPDPAKPRLQREAWAYLAVYGVALCSFVVSDFLLWVWVVPMLIGQPFLRLYLLAEHGHCPPVANMFENSRTTLTNRVVRFLAWNMPYHAEHHAYPTVPFHKLPEFHAMAQAQLLSVSPSYTAFTQDYVSQLKPHE